MALRNQPYIPLYVNDFMTDEKLIECSAESTGVYIRLMCLMHKSEEYGTFLLKQKYKQNQNICLGFAYNLARFLPYEIEVIERSLKELIDNGVIDLDGDKIVQRRMVRDFEISEIRSKVGKIGGDKTKFAQAKLQAKAKQNTEIEYVNENTDVTVTRKRGSGGKGFTRPTIEEVTAYCQERHNSVDPKTWIDYYTANGWKVGSNSMKDWRASVRTWEKRERDNPRVGKPRKPTNMGNFTERSYSDADIDALYTDVSHLAKE